MEINQSVIARMNSIEWFSKCGDNNPINISHNYLFVSDLKEAMLEIQSLKWENHTIEMENELTGYLSNNYKEMYRCWNQLVNQIKLTVYPHLIQKIENSAKEKFKRESQVILRDLEWNLLGIIMAYSYGEYYRSSFYYELLEIYASGHIACGVKGKGSKTYLLIH